MNAVMPRARAYLRIADELRADIGRQCQPGDMLPSENDLVKRHAVHRGTIRQALDVLVREGLIQRYHGRGTVVVDRLATGEFAVVVKPQFLGADASPYWATAAAAIGEALSTRNSRWGAKLHLGRLCEDSAEHRASLDLFEAEVLKRLRGVFAFHWLGPREKELRAARVPVVQFGAHVDDAATPWDEPLRNSVDFDHPSFYEQALVHLKKAGCRNIGVLVHALPDCSARYLDVIARCVEAQGLQISPGWLRARAETGGSVEQGGYETFRRLWETSPRPDGLLVTDDMICRGVLRASLQLGIELPGHLRLISHANRCVTLPYHKTVTRIEFDPAAQARAAVDLMLRLLRNPEAAEPTIRVPVTLIKGETT
ncbi:MAG: GntR family transcriptional regulator [Kiritimatiellae bacterium]|nr:GntR family transcriptional regulator [Kiritimatiellia bacterium]